ncbi:MAG: SCO7613 C-terminal domain-containing membrane protein, partial [Anaerolineae bacterium]
DAAKLWAAGSQLLLGAVYGLVAWDRRQERWGHASAWLGVLGAGLIAVVFSSGRGSSAAKAAGLAAAYVFAERLLHWLPAQSRLVRRRRALLRLAWSLYRRPLLVAGWSVSAGAIGLALVRNLLILGGRSREIWAIVALLLVAGLYAVSARLFRQPNFLWLAAPLLIAPWTLLTKLGWFTAYRPTVFGYALGWAALAWGLLALSLWLARRTTLAYDRPLFWTAQALLPFSLLWAVGDVDTGRITMGLGVGFYGLAALADHRNLKGSLRGPLLARFLYPALGLIPVWSIYLLAWLAPAARHEHYGLLLLLFAPLGLIAGIRLKRLHPADGLPAYLTGYACAAVGTMLVAHDRSLLAGALLYDALIALASAWLFRQPLWVYPAAALAPAALWLALAEGGVPAGRRGWGLIGLGAIYLALAAVLRRLRLGAYATPPLAASFALIALGLPLSSQDRTGAFWAYGAASILYGLAAAGLRQPLLLTPAAALVVVPYAVALQSSRLAPDHYGLLLWPGALAALAAGFLLDQRAGAQGGFPWYRPLAWPAAVADRFMSWWALPVYILGFGLASAGPLFSNGRADWQAANLAGLVLVFAWGAYRFRLRGWLFLSALAGQLAAVSTLAWLGWWAQPDRAALAFLPVTLATAALGLYFEHRYREGSPLRVEDLLWGWSRPLYALVALDLIRFTSFGPSLAATLVTLGHGLLLATLASRWLNRVVAYAATALGALALFQWLSSLEGLPATAFPTPFALLAGLLGLGGYGLTLLRADLDERYELKPAAALWEPVLQRAAHGLALLSLLAAAGLGLDLAGWTVRALLGFPFRQVVEVATVLMAVGVFSILGLFYLLVSVARQRLYLGYLAIGLLLAAWSLYLFFVQALENVQWYALPVGLYLLGISYLEWQRQKAGLRGALARWLDYAAILLMAGTAFWQSLTTPWLYAALLSLEGAGFFWWGSARRLRRIFYAGLVCIVLAVIGQFVQSLLLFNRWIVFGVAGLTLVALAILLERRLEVILERSRDWRERLEMWE